MKKLTAMALGFGLLAAACTGGSIGTPGTPGATFGGQTTSTLSSGVVGLFASSLIEVDSCDALLERIKNEALERVGPYGFGDQPSIFPVFETAVAAAEDQAEGGGGGPAFSTTNIQEIGVDEPDIIKTDGRRILALNDEGLHYIDLTPAGPVLASSLSLPGEGWGQEMLLHGDRVLLIVPVYDQEAGGTRQFMQLVDISDPSDMQVVETLSVGISAGESQYVSARLVEGRITVVFSHLLTRFPGFVFPASDSELSLRRAEEINRLAIMESTLQDWVPNYQLTASGSNQDGQWVDCQASYLPQEFSGLGMLGLFTVDMEAGFTPENVVTLVSEAGTVYASSQNLYVATQRWVPRAWIVQGDTRLRQELENFTTHIHKFDITSPQTATYTASGPVDGFLLNQFALSEHDGFLRVASTNLPAWNPDDRESESRVDVLEEQDGRLQLVGSVGGLGLTEQIFAVRFLGDIGYVVTFRQTDPLYTIDLSDPRNPRTAGELKIPGYSAYLHPIGEGRLLGVGQDADQQGIRSGLQVSLFDVTDLSNPQRIDQYNFEAGTYSTAEYDHRAFLWWGPENLAVLPISGWVDRISTSGAIIDGYPIQSAELLRVGSDSIQYVGSIEHDPIPPPESSSSEPSSGEDFFDWPYYSYQIDRTLVVDDILYTFSRLALAAHDLETLARIAQVNLLN